MSIKKMQDELRAAAQVVVVAQAARRRAWENWRDAMSLLVDQEHVDAEQMERAEENGLVTSALLWESWALIDAAATTMRERADRMCRKLDAFP